MYQVKKGSGLSNRSPIEWFFPFIFVDERHWIRGSAYKGPSVSEYRWNKALLAQKSSVLI